MTILEQERFCFMPNCPHCGNDCSPRAAMCPKCGEPLLDNTIQQLDSQYATWNSNEKKGAGKITNLGAKPDPLGKMPEIEKDVIPVEESIAIKDSPTSSSLEKIPEFEKNAIAVEESIAIKDLSEKLGKTLREYEDPNFHPLGFRIGGGHITHLWLTGMQLPELPPSLGNLRSLQELVLKSNLLSHIPDWLCGLEKLIVLDVDNNHLENLPPAISNLKNLKELFLRDNYLENLPESLGAMGSLERLYLCNNRLCVLPRSLADLSSLKHLDLHHNWFIKFPEFLSEQLRGKGGWDDLNYDQFRGHDSRTGIAINGEVAYDVFLLPSFRETIFHCIIHITNAGVVPIDEVSFQQVFEAEFRPLNLDGIKCYLIRDASKSIEIDSQKLYIQPKDSGGLEIQIRNLGNPLLGGFKVGDTICFKHVIQAVKPSAKVIFRPKISCKLKESPNSTPFEINYTGLKIPVSHVRRKFRKGKEIKALSGEGNYEITLFVENTGDFNLEGMTVTDNLPSNYRARDFNPLEPIVMTGGDSNSLCWSIPLLKPGKGWSQTFRISGEGEYCAHDAQFAL